MKRLPNLRRWLAGLYFASGLLAYFTGEEAWLIFHCLLIFPWSLLFELVSEFIIDTWIAPYTHNTPDVIYQVSNNVFVVFIIVGGAIWMWIVGSWISSCITWLWPLKDRDHELF